MGTQLTNLGGRRGGGGGCMIFPNRQISQSARPPILISSALKHSPGISMISAVSLADGSQVPHETSK